MFCLVDHTLNKTHDSLTWDLVDIEGGEDDFELTIIDTDDFVIETISRRCLEEALFYDRRLNNCNGITKISGLEWDYFGNIVSVYNCSDNHHYLIDEYKRYAIVYEQVTYKKHDTQEEYTSVNIMLLKSGLDLSIYGDNSAYIKSGYVFTLSNLRVEETSDCDLVTVEVALRGKDKVYHFEDIVFSIDSEAKAKAKFGWMLDRYSDVKNFPKRAMFERHELERLVVDD